MNEQHSTRCSSIGASAAPTRAPARVHFDTLLTPLSALLALVIISSLIGCASTNYIQVRRAPRNPLADPLKLLSWSGPQPTPRTEQLLRRYDLAKPSKSNPPVALASLEREIVNEPTPEKIYSYAELAYVSGQRAQELGQSETAFDYYCHALGQAYRYLFDTEVDPFRNPYDPQFRQVCDLYNGALESVLRLLKKNGRLRPGTIERIATKRGEVELAIELKGAWKAEELENLEFASDYEVKGLTNQYHTYGLGVPMIGVGKPIARDNPVAKYYPKGLCFAMTAFLRGPRELDPVPQPADEDAPRKRRFVLELHDPLTVQELPVAGRLVPLETDLSVALGYHLDHLDIEPSALATLGLISPMATDPLEGIYMLEPYSPHKIPVIMVHGLWSSPMTWMEMFNDLRALPEVRDHYQFWFYLYPTGRPFWVSAAKFREDLAELQRNLAPEPERTGLPHTVLVGHSMGGLVSFMQTIHGGDSMWQLLTDQPFDKMKADPPAREALRNVIYFEPQPMVRRVITIGTPHQGSDYANDYTRWLARKLIRLPKMASAGQQLIRDNPDFFRNPELLTTTTSIDSLSSQASIFKFLAQAERSPDVRYHTIIGLAPQSTILPSQPGDGVVSFTSAQLADSESELVVAADHTHVHRHPRSTLEVRRILLEHLQELERPITEGQSGE